MKRGRGYRLWILPPLAAVVAITSWVLLLPARVRPVPGVPAPKMTPPPPVPPPPTSPAGAVTGRADRQTLAVLAPHFRPDGHAAVFLGGAGWLDLYDLEDRRALRRFYLPLPSDCQPRHFTAAVSPDGMRLAVVSTDQCQDLCAWVYDVAGGRLIACLPLGPVRVENADERLYGMGGHTTWPDHHPDDGLRLQFSRDGRRLGVNEADYWPAGTFGPRPFTLWDIDQRRCLARVPLDEHRGGSAALSLDGDWLLADDLKDTAVLWHLTLSPPMSYRTLVQGSWFCWSPNGRWVLGQGSTPSAALAGKRGCRSLAWPPADEDGATAFSPDSKSIMCCSQGFRVGQREPVAGWDYWMGRSMRFSADGRRAISFGVGERQDAVDCGLPPLDTIVSLLVYDAEQGKPLARYAVPVRDTIRHTAVRNVRWTPLGPVLDWDQRDETCRPDPVRGSSDCHPTATPLTPAGGWLGLHPTDPAPGEGAAAPLLDSAPFELQFCVNLWRSPDKRRWVGYTDDEVVRVGRSTVDNEDRVTAFVSLLALDDWVAWTPDGRFAGTPKGEARLQFVTWNDGVATAVEAAAGHAERYRPDELAKILAALPQ
jgi:hypothetical protein